MKKAKSNQDNRFAVGGTTAKINAIKKNNETLALIDQLQTIIETITNYGCASYYGKPMADNLLYKDKNGNEIDQHDFWDNLHYFVDRNHDYLLRDSKEIFESLKKAKVA